METLRQVFIRILHLLARFAPGATTVRPFLHRLRGVKIRGSVFIGEDVYLENDHPECVEIHDQAQVGLRTIIMAHFRGTGRVIIEEKVWIGVGSTIAAAAGQTLTIGVGSVVGAGAVVTKSVPPGMFVAGVPARPRARVTVPMTLTTSLEEFRSGVTPLTRE